MLFNITQQTGAASLNLQQSRKLGGPSFSSPQIVITLSSDWRGPLFDRKEKGRSNGVEAARRKYTGAGAVAPEALICYALMAE